MTAICGGGTSSPKPGVDTSVYIDTAFIRSLMPASISWLYPYVPFMPPIDIGSVSSFCATDPPTVPGIPSAQDFFLFVTAGPIGQTQDVSNFIGAVLKQYIWRSLCQCDVGSASAYTPPSDPGGLVSVNNPSLVAPTTQGPCYDFTSGTVNWTAGSSLTRSVIDLFAVDANFNQLRIPHYVQWDIQTSVVVAPGPTLSIQVVQNTAGVSSGNQALAQTYSILPGVKRSIVHYIIPGSNEVFYTVTAGAQSGTTAEFTRTRLWCWNDGLSNAIAPYANIDQTNAMLRQLIELVTLVQRQKVPYAYIDGATHSGLSGAATITIPSGLIGLRTTITTTPDYVGSAGSNPGAIFDVGYLSVGDSTGWAETQPIRRSPWNWFPPDMSTWTRVGYNLNPGVVVSITELEPEP